MNSREVKITFMTMLRGKEILGKREDLKEENRTNTKKTFEIIFILYLCIYAVILQCYPPIVNAVYG